MRRASRQFDAGSLVKYTRPTPMSCPNRDALTENFRRVVRQINAVAHD
jgi:hypothetical protein